MYLSWQDKEGRFCELCTRMVKTVLVFFEPSTQFVEPSDESTLIYFVGCWRTVYARENFCLVDYVMLMVVDNEYGL